MFWANVVKSDGCWLWTGAFRQHWKIKYGVTSWNGQSTGAHRVAWQIERGPIPARIEIAHRCDNGLCVRIDHLWPATHAENMLDMKLKGRARCGRGEQNGGNIFSNEQVLAMREAFAAGDSTTIIARRMKAQIGTVRGIVRGKGWAHLPGAIPVGGVDGRSARAKVSAGQRVEMKRLRAAGTSVEELASQFGVSVRLAYKATSGDRDGRKDRAKLSDAACAALRAARAKGLNIAAMSRALGVTATYAHHVASGQQRRP